MTAPETDGVAALWTRCEACTELVYRKQLERRLFVCPRCGHHFRLTAAQRLQQLLDRGSFVERNVGVGSRDVLGFPDQPPYPERLRAEFLLAHGLLDAVVERRDLRRTLARVLTLMRPARRARSRSRRPARD